MNPPMTPTPPDRADAVFAAALELPFEEREANVLESCGGYAEHYDKEFTFKKAYPMSVNIVVHALKALAGEN